MKGSVLLVEDHRDLAETISMALESAGFTMDYAADGPEALRLATENMFDCIVLDLMLPGIDGLAVCRRLRNDHGIDTPVLMLTARDRIEDKLTGFEHGADDYLVKPFVIEELKARVNALVSRKRGETASTRIIAGDLMVDTRTREVTRRGRPLDLSPTGFRILRILLREAPAVVSRETIEHELWGEDAPDSDALRSHVYILRKALDKPFEPDDATMIRTVKGVGFRLDLS
ncbi:MAG: response regulator transcription factor [Gammaproteobacteria bacterium]|nr:response regulator transcription factor [Gammaproteobacteria bacterium]MYH90637.1 response regulator transcription factor [Gammaproteobacteria bacterium]